MDVSHQFHAVDALPVRKVPLVLKERRLSGTWSQSGCGGNDQNLLPVLGIKLHFSSLKSVTSLS
jgi:hypothetical protein